MDTKSKIKLAIAIGALVCAVGLIAWYLTRDSGTQLDPERKGPEVTAPIDEKTGKPIENFKGNSRTPGAR